MNIHRISRVFASFALLQGSVVSASAQMADAAGAGAASPAVRLEIVDRTPKFLDFYDAAVAENAAPQRRWELWKERYDFAALPPVPERDSLARVLLDDAWPRYPGVMAQIRGGAEALRPEAEATLRSVVSLLGADSATLQLIVYVGALENNAFFFAYEGRQGVMFPLEGDARWRETALPHEMAHAVHHQLAGYSEGWERTIARTLFAEGLATRVAQVLVPGRDDAGYLEHRAGWFAEAEAHREAILRGILPALGASDSETVMRFTMGRGTTGVDREAYYVGWLVVGDLLERGWTMAELARVPEDETPALVAESIRHLLGDANG